jgi:hypothetical protein
MCLNSRGRGVSVFLSRSILNEPNYMKSYDFNKCNKSPDRDYYRSLALEFYNHYGIEYNDNELCAIGMAFEDYKKHKEEYISEVADLYRNYEYNGKVYHLIDERTYNALKNWEISILD